MKHFRVVLQLLMCMCMLFAIAHTSALAQSKSWSIRTIDTKRGLSSRNVTHAFVDNVGYVWLSTRDGLDRWDGRSISTFLRITGDSASIADSWPPGISQMSNGTMYFCSRGGVSYFDRRSETFSNWKPGNGTAEDANMHGDPTIINDSLTYLWTGSDGHYIFDVKNRKRIHLVVEDPQTHKTRWLQRVVTPVVDKTGQVWMSTLYGIGKLTWPDSVVRIVDTSIKSHEYGFNNVLVQSEPGSAWLVRYPEPMISHVSFSDKTQHLSVTLDQIKKPEVIINYRALSSDSLLISTNEGKFALITRVGATLNTTVLTCATNGIVLSQLINQNAMLGDGVIRSKTGTVWMCAVNGVFEIDVVKGVFEYHELFGATNQVAQRRSIIPFYVDTSGRLFAIDRGNGFIIADRMRTGLQSVSGINGKIVNVIGIDADRSMLVYSDKGLGVTVYNMKSKTMQHLNINFPPILSNYTNKRGDVWIGTREKIIKLDPKTWKRTDYVIPPALSGPEAWSRSVHGFGETADGRFWGLTEQGMLLFDNASKKFIRKPAPEEPGTMGVRNSVTHIVVSPRGENWLRGYDEIGRLINDDSIEQVVITPKDKSVEELSFILHFSFIDNTHALIVDHQGIVHVDLTNKTYTRTTSPFIKKGRKPYQIAFRSVDETVWLMSENEVEQFDLTTWRFRFVPLDNDRGEILLRASGYVHNGPQQYMWFAYGESHGVLDPLNIPKIRTDARILYTGLYVADTVKTLPRWLNDMDTVELSHINRLLIRL